MRVADKLVARLVCVLRWGVVAGALVVSLLLAGCSTVESRIGEHADLFASLDRETRDNLLSGRVELGYSMAMAYIAFGAPSEVHRGKTEKGETVTWVYQYSYPLYHDGYFFRHGRHHRFPHYYYDYYYDYYEVLDYLRLVFVNGLVTSIEEIEY